MSTNTSPATGIIPGFFTSSYSANGGNCVGVRLRESIADVCDTKNPTSGYLSFSSEEWAGFLSAGASTK